MNNTTTFKPFVIYEGYNLNSVEDSNLLDYSTNHGEVLKVVKNEQHYEYKECMRQGVDEDTAHVLVYEEINITKHEVSHLDDLMEAVKYFQDTYEVCVLDKLIAESAINQTIKEQVLNTLGFCGVEAS